MTDPITLFITWTTYGAWLPGDERWWRKKDQGPRPPQPLLEKWCHDRLIHDPTILTERQRLKVESVCREHAAIRGWVIHAIRALSNHVHVVVTADKKPHVVRDQFKANATRVLRDPPDPLIGIVWTRGGDCEILDDDESLERVVAYVLVAQDRMDRGK